MQYTGIYHVNTNIILFYFHYLKKQNISCVFLDDVIDVNARTNEWRRMSWRKHDAQKVLFFFTVHGVEPFMSYFKCLFLLWLNFYNLNLKKLCYCDCYCFKE